MTNALSVAALSDVGRVRRDNQDSGYAGAHLLVIADGVGGAARGDVASSATIEALRKLDVPPGNDALSELAATIHLAHDRITEIVEQHPELDGTSTTVTAALFDGTHLRLGHVGDSRGYLLRDGVLEPLTTDHTLVQSLIDEGRITEAEARVHPHRNLILKAVDGVHEPEPDLFSVEVRPGDRVLLCSDGASGVLENEVMAQLMAGPLTDAAQRLVRSALDAGSSDNVTVILADVIETEVDPGTPAPAGLVVGAAATSPHLRMDESTGNLSEGDLVGLGTTDSPELDPEDIRYAPQAPRRFTWFRRLVVLTVLAAAAGYGGYRLYDWSQEQYYLGLDEGTVVVFQGVDVPMLYSVAESTGLNVGDLPDTEKRSVEIGIPVDDVAAAQSKIAELRKACRTNILTTFAVPALRPPLRTRPLPDLLLSAVELEIREKCWTS